MSWKTLTLCTEWTTMDPGITHSDEESVSFDRKELLPGTRLIYPDPSRTLAPVMVLELHEEWLTLQVGKEQAFVPAGRWTTVDKAGRDYTNFELRARIFPADEPSPLLELGMNAPAVRRLTTNEVLNFRKAGDCYSTYALAAWYNYFHPEPDSWHTAADLYAKAAKMGCADALVALGVMYLRGKLGEKDPKKYAELRDEGRHKGSMYGEFEYYRDMAFGFNHDPNPRGTEYSIERDLKWRKNPSPRWYDILGWAKLDLGKKEEAAEAFRTAIDMGMTECYDGLWVAKDGLSADEIEAAKKAGNGTIWLMETEAWAEEYKKADEIKKLLLHKQIDINLKTSIELGENCAPGALGWYYYKGDCGYPENDDLAWKWFTRGFELGDNDAGEMLQTMKEEGYDPDPEEPDNRWDPYV